MVRENDLDMSTIFLLLDAFRRDYLSEDNTPFLWKCAQEGEYYEGVIQSLGFCERTEIFTGLRGDQSGFLTAIGFDPSNSPYADVKILPLFGIMEQIGLGLLKLAPKEFRHKVHKRLRSYAQQYFQRRNITMPTFFIPYRLLPFFSLTEDRVDLRRPDAFSHPSIFKLLFNAGKTYFYDSFTALGLVTPYASEQERLDAVIKDLLGNKKDLYLVYISIPDTYGHLFGPESAELSPILCNMDQMLERFVKQAEEISPNNRFLFIGDHGMLTVTTHYDAKKEIDALLGKFDLINGQDVLYFLDSTMVRFWAMSNRAQKKLPRILKDASGFSAHGTWMTPKKAKQFHVPWPDRRYGDHLWIANAGVLVFPDFFHRIVPCKGMHGYDPNLPESQGVCIHWGKGIKTKRFPTIKLSDTFDVLKRSVEIFDNKNISIKKTSIHE